MDGGPEDLVVIRLMCYCHTTHTVHIIALLWGLKDGVLILLNQNMRFFFGLTLEENFQLFSLA